MITPAYGLTATERVLPRLALDWTTGSAQSGVDVTRTGVATYIDLNGDLQNAAENTQRVDYSTGVAGLLVEESRTNSLVNSTNVGAAVGSPGTPPTNWTINSAGLASEVASIGVENGVSYIDLRLFGTTSATAIVISFQAYGLITAAQNEQWAFSSWLKIVSGSTANISSIVFFAQERTSTGSLTANLLSPALSVDGTLSRLNHVFTLTNASTQRLQPSLRLNAASGVAVDITLRIGLPQVEKGAFATSVIPTTTTAVTRNADVATVTGTNFSDFYNATEGTFFCDVNPLSWGGSTTFETALSANDGTASNVIAIQGLGGPSTRVHAYARVAVSNIQQVALLYATNVGSNNLKAVFAYKNSSFAAATNGAAVATSATGSLPTVDRLNIMNESSNFRTLNGHMRKIMYWPQRLTNNEVVAFSKG